MTFGDPMPEFRRNVRCMNCGNERNFYVSTDMQISDLLLHGKCLQCNSSIQINFSLIGQEQTASSTTESSSSSSDSGMVNLDETLFEPEIPSSALKDLIEE